MEQWNYNLDDSRKFEQPLTIQDYEFHLGMHQGAMVPQAYLQDQCFRSRLSFIEEMAAYLQKSLVDDDKRWHESQERSAKIDQLISQINVDRLFEQDHGDSTLHSSEFFDPNPLLVHNDNIDVHSCGAKRESNAPLSHVFNDIVHHDFILKEDGNREEELVLPGIGLEDCDIMHSRSNKGVDKEAGGEENVPSGDLVLDRGSKNGTASLTVNPSPSTKIEPPLELSKQQKRKQKKKKKGLMNKLSEVFKKADANVPLLDLIETVPAYAQFLKSLHLHKKRFVENEKFQLNEEMSAVIQHRLPQWKHEFGSFIIGCRIGDETFDGALMDLNTNVNIMPLATYQRLAIGPMKNTSVSLQLADGATRLPVGIVEDVLIRVNKFILPADFVVLDMNEDLHRDQECPIIFGKPFMATAGVKINVQKGTVCLKVLGEKVKLQVCQPCYTEEAIQEVFATDLVRGIQAKSDRIFGPLNPLRPPVQDHPSTVVANQELS